MNEAGRNALRAAALNGVRQIVGRTYDDAGGRCGQGVLAEALLGHPGRAAGNVNKLGRAYGLYRRVERCPLCGSETASVGTNGVLETQPLIDECGLLAHLNNDHRLDLLGIAEKMPVTDELGGA